MNTAVNETLDSNDSGLETGAFEKNNDNSRSGESSDIRPTKRRIDRLFVMRFMPRGVPLIEDQSFVLSVVENLFDGCYQERIKPYVSMCDESNYLEVVKRAIAEEVDAIVILAFDMRREEIDCVTQLDFHSIPTIFVGSGVSDPNYDTVNLANVEESYSAVKFFYENGYRAVGYLHSEMDFYCFQNRAVGFDMAIRDFGINCPVKLVMPSTIGGSRAFICEWLKKKPAMPRAFFADNDNTALGAMSAFLEAGYRIPEDISILGMDDLVYSTFSQVPLTTIHISRRQIARAALDILTWDIGESAVHISCRGRLVIRNSTRTFDPKSEEIIIRKR